MKLWKALLLLYWNCLTPLACFKWRVRVAILHYNLIGEKCATANFFVGGETHTVVVTDMNVVYEFGNGRSYPVVIEMSHLELPYGYKVVQLAAGNHLSVAAIEGTHDASGPYVVIWGNVSEACCRRPASCSF